VVVWRTKLYFFKKKCIKESQIFQATHFLTVALKM
jgi:hypothetical protein